MKLKDYLENGWKQVGTFAGEWIILAKEKKRILYDEKEEKVIIKYDDTPAPAGC